MANQRDAWTKAINSLSRPRSKYGAKKTTVDGIVFDSKREAQRYHELKLREKAGEIRHLVLQPMFLLSAPIRTGSANDKGSVIGHYVADFAYEDRDIEWRQVFEDVKGFKTPLYRWKKKHVEAQYGIQIREV